MRWEKPNKVIEELDRIRKWRRCFVLWPMTIEVGGRTYRICMEHIERCYIGTHGPDIRPFSLRRWPEYWRVRFSESLIERNERIMRGEPRPGGDLGEPATDHGGAVFNMATGQWEKHQVQSTKALVQSMQYGGE